MLRLAVWSILVGATVGDVGLGTMPRPLAPPALQASLLADPADGKKTKPGPPNSKEHDELPGPFKLPPHIEPSAPQRADLVKLYEVFEPRRKGLQEATDAVYTSEQRQAMKLAREKAHDAGLKGKEAEATVQSSVTLSAEQAKRLEALHVEARDLDETIRSAVLALLTPEQRAQFKPGPGGKKAQPKKGPPPKPEAK